MNKIILSFLLLAAFGCSRPVIITGKITNYKDSIIIVNGKNLPVSGVDSTFSFTINDENCTSGGKYFNIKAGFDINIFAQKGDKITLLIDRKTRKVTFSGDEQKWNEQILQNELRYDSIKMQVDKYHLFGSDFKTFSDKVDSMLNQIKSFDNAPAVCHKYEKVRAECFKAILNYGYGFNHSLLIRQHYSLPVNFIKTTPEIHLNDSSLLEITDFCKFLDIYLDTKGKLIALDNPKGYTDNIFTNCKMDIALNESGDARIKNWLLYKIMVDHFTAYDARNAGKLFEKFNTVCTDLNLRNKIATLYQSKLQKNRDFKTVVYKKRKNYDLKAYVFQPKTSLKKSLPVVCCFFGGGWYEGTPEQFFDYCRFFTEKNYVAISFDYSIKGRFNTTPIEALQDVKSAIRWTRMNAKRLNIDPDNITTIGWSAGGHLTAASTLIDGFNDPREDSIISVQPKFSVLIAPCFEPLKDNWFYYQLDSKCDPARLSPTQNIKKVNTKFLCLIGTKDEYNPLSTATDFERLMITKGNVSRLVIKDGYHHNGFMNRLSCEMIYKFMNN